MRSNPVTSPTQANQLLYVLQKAVDRWNVRGLPRLAWQIRSVALGRGRQSAWYQRRFRFVCNCDSRYGVMQAYGFVHRAIDRVLQELITQSTDEVHFFDIGANVGFVSMLACSLAPRRVQAHCFEPNPTAIERLRQHAAMNPFNMTINAYALGDAPGNIEMMLGAESSNSTVVQGGYAEVESIGQIEIEMKTLDAYCTERGIWPSIVKLDVEGFEPRVLEGGMHTLSARHPPMILEVNSKALVAGHSSASKLLEQLVELGYRAYLIEPRQVGLSVDRQRIRPQWRGYPEALKEDFMQPRLCDVVAIPHQRVR